MSDLIDRQEAISRAVELRMYGKPVKMVAVSELERLPSVRAEHGETTLPEQADSDGLGVNTGETCADVISRQVAMVVINCSGLDDDSKDTVVRVLEQLPSAQPERKTGRWIEENPQNSPDCRLIKCSECGDTYIVNMSIDYADWIEGRNFCRRCGADLRGGNNGKST